MVSRLSDIELCRQVWDLLRERLGPVEAMRFLSLVRSQPRDYVKWRDEQFRELTLIGLLEQLDPPPQS